MKTQFCIHGHDTLVVGMEGRSCKLCRQTARAIDHKNHPERQQEKTRRFNLKNKFGLTVDQWQILFDKQNGCCAICGIHQSRTRTRLHVDHDHKTGEIRGLLCSDCNLALATIENKEYCVKASLYLARSK